MASLRFLSLTAALGLAAVLGAQSPAPVYPPLSGGQEAEMNRDWQRLQRRNPSDSVRGLYLFILTAAARGWHPEKLPAVINLVEELHERDSSSSGYGNYRWFWSDAHPNDLNAVQFAIQTASLTWVLYGNRLVPEAREKLLAALALGAEGVVRQKVAVSYNNIFLMRAANAILVGQSTGRADLVVRGKGWLDEWFAFARENGIHEFSSPTYYAVDLADLGSLSRYAADTEVKSKADAALRFMWTDIAANWFEPHQGISGANSRDYGFLKGHGYLDQHLRRAGWIHGEVSGEARPLLDDVTHVDPPKGIREQWGEGPRMVSQQYGPKPTERAFHYVGRHFSIGSAGESYGAQDRMFALTFDGGPNQPIASFSFDYRNDPYGQGTIATSGGHDKLTHLEPFVASIQRGPEVLYSGYVDARTTPNPAGRNQPMAYAGVWGTLVLPSDVAVWQENRAVGAGSEVRLKISRPIFLRFGGTAAAVRFAFVRDDRGRVPGLSLIRDGGKLGAQRLSVPLAAGKPQAPVTAALWVRVAEGLDDGGFRAFASAFEADNAGLRASEKDGLMDIAAPGTHGKLEVSADVNAERVVGTQGGDLAMLRGVLNVNGIDYGNLLFPAFAKR